MFLGEDHVYVVYRADGSFEDARIYKNNEWYYYYPDGSWERGVEALLTPPAGYENADVAYFESILPTTINCAHENIKAADCESPEYCLTCGIVSEGSEPLGHNYVGELTLNSTCSSVGEMTYVCQNDASHVYTEEVAIDENAHAWNEGAVTTDPTCTEKGVKTYTCTHNSEHTKTEEVAIDENAHAWNEGAVTTDPTCTEKGVKTFTCTHSSEHTKTEDVAALGHKYDNACDATCNTCGEERIPADHIDEDENNTCEVCGAEIPKDGLSGGAIAGIVAGSTVTAGAGGFSLFWFVIKKRKWSDLVTIFKK